MRPDFSSNLIVNKVLEYYAWLNACHRDVIKCLRDAETLVI